MVFFQETVRPVMMLNKDTKEMVHSADFDTLNGVLQGDT